MRNNTYMFRNTNYTKKSRGMKYLDSKPPLIQTKLITKLKM
jgi:hypothetical protein